MKKHLELMEWIHATLIFALFIPLVYAVCPLTATEGTALFYLKCLLVAVPVAVTGIAARRVKTLGVYILICAALLAAIYGIAAGLSRLMGQEEYMEAPALCYRVGMLAETVVIAGIRLVDRIKRGRYEKRRKTDPFILYTESFLNRPSVINVYFIVMYMTGIFFDSKMLCDMALFSAVVYLFPALAHTFFKTTEQYLSLNRHTKGIPVKRLYAVSGGMLCLYAALLLAICLPSFLLINARRYTDVREWSIDAPPAPVKYESSMEFQTTGTDMGGLSQLPMENVEEIPVLSMLWEALFWGLGIVCAIVFVCAAAVAIKNIFQEFRQEIDENGDKIEDLEEKTESIHITAAREQDSETNKIKHLYKRTIRKHRKERPAVYETPAEIEEKAGLAEDAAMQALHVNYERVRYGR